MLDVVHYLFESDSLVEKETQDAKVRMRRTVYGQLYGRAYTWGSETADGNEYGTQEVASGDVFSGGSGSSGDPQLTHKPYIPPTPVDASSAKPYGTVLDAPLG